MEDCAKFCTELVLGMIVLPVYSLVPAVAELFKMKGVWMQVVGTAT